jgi:hypothetical protein
MGLSTERKVFIGLFTVAAAALIMDQAILGPSSAGADVINTGLDLSVEPVPAIAEPVGSRLEATAASLLNERLADVAVGDAGADSLLNSLFMQPKAPVASIDAGLSSRQVQQSQASVPSNLPGLSAVMPTSNGGAAVLDGVLLREGETNASGYRLITVERRSVTIEKNGKSYILAVPVHGG